MIVCDVCKEQVGDNYIQVSIRGEQRMKLYEYGLKNTNFDVCSINCAIEILNQIKILIPKQVKT